MAWHTLRPTSPELTDAHTGGDVSRAQHLLASNRFGNFHPGTPDGQYGPVTASATHRAKRWLGYRHIDHVFGPSLHDYLGGDKLPLAFRARRAVRLLAHKRRMAATPIRVQAFNLAMTQVGVHESPSGSNDQKYGVWYGANGVPWCAEFVSWLYTHVGRPLHYSYVPDIVSDARANRNRLSVVSHVDVQQGDLVCFDWPGESPGTADHVGIFDRWVDKAAGIFATVEGNTSLQSDPNGSQSNGGIVAHRTNRSISTVQAFVHVHR